jgi:acetate kinase
VGSPILLVVNGGSSSCKASLFDISDFQEPIKIADTVLNLDETQRITQTTTWYQHGEVDRSDATIASVPDMSDALCSWLESLAINTDINFIGHRVVHGGNEFSSATVLNDKTFTALQRMSGLDHLHADSTNAMISRLRSKYPNATHVACFDTTFFTEMPDISKLIALPKTIQDTGVRRYGFHGLSYSYVSARFGHLAGDVARRGRVIYAHLGSGSSLVSIMNGHTIDTTMGFSPASGIPSATRVGDTDPTIASYVNSAIGISDAEFARLSQTESGIKAVSETTGDMKRLLSMESTDPKAGLAIDFYVYNVQKAIGALAAGIGGIDSLVFTGGIGEQSSDIRRRICSSLSHLGIVLDDTKNDDGEFTISSHESATGVHVIPTDEAQTIVQQTIQLITDTKGTG